MKKINIDALKKGDVILTTSLAKKPSGLIKRVTKSDISHAMLYVSYASVIDSTGEGVQARNIQKMLYDDACSIYVLRLKDSISDEMIKAVVDYARASIGTRYSKIEAAASVTPKLTSRSGKKQFCSRMVARAYAKVGIKLVKNSDYCTPEDLKKSELLKFIKTPSVAVTQVEIDAIEEEGDATKGMRQITNRLLNELRKLDESVENINEINSLVIKHPEYDAQVSKAIINSGYLDYWRVELEQFPWRYDPILIAQHYHSLSDPKILLDYCRETINQDQNGDFAHWETNANKYNELHKVYQLETFRLFYKLYLEINYYHSLRLKSASMILRVYGK